LANKPSRGEVWHADLEPVEGHEQGMSRPCLVISDDMYNHGPSEMVALVPITRTGKAIPLHVPIDPPEGGVKSRSFIMCDQPRTVSLKRVGNKWGEVTDATLRQVEDRLRIFLSLQ
jgi:mRNA interferase MazF